MGPEITLAQWDVATPEQKQQMLENGCMLISRDIPELEDRVLRDMAAYYLLTDLPAVWDKFWPDVPSHI